MYKIPNVPKIKYTSIIPYECFICQMLINYIMFCQYKKNSLLIYETYYIKQIRKIKQLSNYG